MSLDARVFCDCFERGRTAPPPAGLRLGVDDDGSVVPADGASAEEYAAYDRWRAAACVHPNGELAAARLGNVAEIGALRELLKGRVRELPILMGKVLFSGSHTGDFLGPEDVRALGAELEIAAAIAAGLPGESGLGTFVERLRGLRECAIGVGGKPIVF